MRTNRTKHLDAKLRRDHRLLKSGQRLTVDELIEIHARAVEGMLRDLRSDISPGLKKRIADALTQAEKEWRDIQDLAREQLKRRMQEGRLHYLELERELY